MLKAVTPADLPAFEGACALEHIFGSKIWTAARAYGLEDPQARFFLSLGPQGPNGAVYLNHGLLTVTSDGTVDPDELASLARQEGISEVNTDRDTSLALQRRLGGVTDHSWFMVYEGGPVEGDFSDLSPAQLPAIFDVLQRSHPYYQKHYVYDSWSADLLKRQAVGLSESWQLTVDGRVVGTGCIGSEDSQCGVLGALAVLPEYRGRGLGSHILLHLTRRVLEKGKTPRLMPGYDAVAGMYRRLGFAPCGRWGELCL